MANFIKTLVADRYNLFNVGGEGGKQPIGKNGWGLKDWEKKTYDELVKEHNYNCPRWGLYLGEQANGKFIMSLDFDIYDKSTKTDCPITKGFLTEYLENCENQNGMYSSSTDGNMNVLVDYTESEHIKSLFKQIGATKFTNHGLEILIRQNQVIPPTATPCKRTKTMGKPRTFINPDQPFYIIRDDDPEDFTYGIIKQLCEEKLAVTNKKPAPPPPTTPTASSTPPPSNGGAQGGEAPSDKFIDLLFNVIKNEKDEHGKYKINMTNGYYFQIAGALKTQGYKFEIFDKYTNSMPDKPKTNTAQKLWNGIGSAKNISIHTLQNIAKDINPSGYKAWLCRWNVYLHLGILDKGENDIAKFVAPFLIENLVFCQGVWYSYKASTGLWKAIAEPSATIINFIQNKINEALECCLSQANKKQMTDEELKELDKVKAMYNAHYKKVCSGGTCSQLVKFSKDYLSNDDFLALLDQGLYIMAFRNGIFDLKTFTFSQGIKRSDYITKTIPFDYEEPKPEDEAVVREVLKKICNYNEKHLDYYLSIFGYSFTGDSDKEQNFYYHRGQTASNGKSFVFEILEKLMPNYVIKANSDILDKGADLRKEVATWLGKKLLWLNEVSTKPKDAELIKQIGDGTGVKFNKLYAVEAPVMPVTFKLFAVSNYSLDIKVCEGTRRRFKLLQHNSQFKDDYEDDYEKLEFKNDKNLKTKLLNEYKHALIHLIMRYSHAYFKEGKLKEYPKEWSQEAKENMEENDSFGEWFETEFNVGEGLKIHKDTVEEMMKHFNAKTKTQFKLKDELKRIKIKYTYNSQEQNYYQPAGNPKPKSIRYKGFYSGFCPVKSDMFGAYKDDAPVEDESVEDESVTTEVL